MRHRRWFVVLVIVLWIFAPVSVAQLETITIPAGTPEDQALQEVTKQPDPQKKLAMYEDFVQKFSSTPAAVAYGNWQISQYYQGAGDLPKALAYGDKALAGSPHNLDILVSLAGIAQQMKNNSKLLDYAVHGGEIYNSLGKSAKPEGMSDQEFSNNVENAKTSARNSYEFLEAAAFNVIVGENDAKVRMADIERFTPAFPGSRFEDSVASYAMMSLSELKDMARLLSYGEKVLATHPHSLPTLLLLAGAYADDPKPGSTAKAAAYAQKAIAAANADAPDADRSRKMSAGVAHSTLGYVYMKQDKTAAAIPELKTASALLRGQDDQQCAIALYRLGFAYAKLSRTTEARDALTEAVKTPGPVQALSQDLLSKVNAARAKGK
ncbi:MAG TPA: tetratricopeptide repeat protein [Terriglobales bacterium]|nr:tetratricopeptide repeat protein [Terriglobales bacterium]